MKRAAKAVAVATMVMAVGTSGARAGTVASVLQKLPFRAGIKIGLTNWSGDKEKYFGGFVETKPKRFKYFGVAIGVEATDGFGSETTVDGDVTLNYQFEKKAVVPYIKITSPNDKFFVTVGRGKITEETVGAFSDNFGAKLDFDGDRTVISVGYNLTNKISLSVKRGIDKGTCTFPNGSTVEDTVKGWGVEMSYAF